MIAGLEEESNVVVAFIDENLSREEAVALEPAILAVPQCGQRPVRHPRGGR